ncbi:putative metalloprotease CJM1_0395 family protein [Zobellella sp. DQSA1]|uniref:putative metalloprotease CJM1_0395 family protein n=1 Tax=Zobellella sp. DQSA1 TaxID=3342386 RepID=UPI0035BFF6F0
MQIGTVFGDIAFTPAPPVTGPIRQDNEQREHVPPAGQADAFAGSDPRREQDGPDEFGLYDARGRKTGDTADAKDNSTTGAAADETAEGEATEASGEPARPTKPSGEEMSAEEVQQLQELLQRDREVRIHEQLHASVGGQHAGAPSYEFETGPDGKQYAVGGEVQIDISPIPGDPRATIEKMRQVKAAALAPAEPSQADKAAAARAEQHIRNAQAELLESTAPTRTATPGLDDHSGPTPAPDGEAPDSAGAQDRAKDQMAHRNQVITGVYGKAAQAHSRSLLNLA